MPFPQSIYVNQFKLRNCKSKRTLFEGLRNSNLGDKASGSSESMFWIRQEKRLTWASSAEWLQSDKNSFVGNFCVLFLEKEQGLVAWEIKKRCINRTEKSTKQESNNPLIRITVQASGQSRCLLSKGEGDQSSYSKQQHGMCIKPVLLMASHSILKSFFSVAFIVIFLLFIWCKLFSSCYWFGSTSLPRIIFCHVLFAVNRVIIVFLQTSCPLRCL
jgi:hypothetical protein